MCFGDNAHAVSAVSRLFLEKADAGVCQITRESAARSMLVVYCLRNMEVFSGNHGLPELIAICLVAALHLWKRQMLLSIAGGTICYMFLVQTIF